MTVLTTNAQDEGYTQYDTNGKQTYFEYGFTLFPGDTIAVFLKDKRIFNFDQRAKGIIIKPAPTGRLVIVRQLVIDQTRNFMAFDSFNAEWTEAAMDKLILLKQEAAEYRSFMNITAAHYTSFVKITNDKGTDADIYVWTGANDEGVPVPPEPPPPDPNLPPTESGLSNDFTQYDQIVDWSSTPTPPLHSAGILLTVYPNGYIDVVNQHGGEPASFPQDWNEQSPLTEDPQNYESRITLIDGQRYLYYRNDQDTAWVQAAYCEYIDQCVYSSPWQNLENQNRYQFAYEMVWEIEGRYFRWVQCQLEIREVGKPETVKIKPLELRLIIET